MPLPTTSEKLISVVSRAVTLIGQDFELRGLNINVNKSCGRIIGPSCLDTVELTYNNISLPEVSYTRLLGVIVNEKLSWEDHCPAIWSENMIGKKIGDFFGPEDY